MTPFFPPHIGGMERALRRIASAVSATGHEVHVHTSQIGAADAPESDKNHYVVHREHVRLENWAAAARHWASGAGLDALMVASFGPDTRTAMGAMALEQQARGVRTVWRSPTADHAFRNLSGEFAGLLEGIDIIVANSEASAERTSDAIHRTVHVIPNLLLDDEIKGAALDAQAPRMCDVAWVGRVSPRKRPEQLLEILRRLADAGLDVHVQATHGYGEAELYERFIAALPTEVKRHGASYAQPVEVRRATVFLHVSEVEGSPNSVLEAALRGSIPITSDIPECRQLLAGTSSRFLVEGASDIGEIVGEVSRLSTPEVRREQHRVLALRHNREAVTALWLSVLGA